LIGDTLRRLPLATYGSISTTSGYVERAIHLRGTGLDGEPRVFIQWCLLPDSTNNTGVLRIDDVIVEALSPFDLAVTALSAQPRPVSAVDPIRLSATVRHLGVGAGSPFSVDFYRDTDNDGSADDGERFDSRDSPALASGDSTVVTAEHPPLRVGLHRFLAVVRSPDDVTPANDTAAVVVDVGVPPGSVLVNEILYAPVGDEPEWIELLNASPDTVDLRAWRVSDSNIGSTAVLSDTSVLVRPGGFVIVAREVSVRDLHPELPAPVLVVPFSSLNNTTPDAVVLTNRQGSVMDSVFYLQSWGGSGGKSLERIDPDEASADPANWRSSEDSAGSTPGRINSVARLDHDLMLVRLWSVRGPDGATIQGVVRNVGKLPAYGFRLILTEIHRAEGITREERTVAELTHAGTLARGDSVIFSYHHVHPPSGEVEIQGHVLSEADGRLRNNMLSISLAIPYEENNIVINEILYDPLAGQNEWIELYHRGSASIDLKNWTIADRPTAAGSRIQITLSPSGEIIQPGDLIVLAADSSLLTLFPHLRDSLATVHVLVANRAGGLGLGNEGDDIVLYDHTGASIDSLSYSPSWHTPEVEDTRGRSLERINPDLSSTDRRNWGTSATGAGGSPGLRNTLFTLRLPERGTLTISPNPFSPDGDGFEEVTLIRYSLPEATAVVRIRIFDAGGRLIRTLADGEPAGSAGEVVWNGFDDGGRRARIGPHIVLLEASDSRGGSVTALKAVAVVATKL
jgi:hypothetical protein